MTDWPRVTILLHGLVESAADLGACAAARDARTLAGVLELLEMQIAEVRELLGAAERPPQAPQSRGRGE
jgi:hypothetical protein